jgi:hypothetical protein
MKFTIRGKLARQTGKRTAAANKQILFERFANTYGPQSEKPPSDETEVGAVELLVKLRRGKA